jgi:hypothetical protein
MTIARLVSGARVLERWFPGFRDELIKDGAEPWERLGQGMICGSCRGGVCFDMGDRNCRGCKLTTASLASAKTRSRTRGNDNRQSSLMTLTLLRRPLALAQERDAR